MRERHGPGPGAAVADTGSRKAQASFGKRAAAFSRHQESPQRHLSVYSGREALGAIDYLDGTYITFDANGVEVGRYQSLKKAVAALGDGGVS